VVRSTFDKDYFVDAITQGLLGAAAGQAVFGGKVKRAGLIGAVGGLIPDLDVLIRSSSDPLLAIEFHRQFTHSLIFIPIGGLIAALPWILRKRHRPQVKAIVGAATVGYATHAPLDSCTTYGTQLFWPFSDFRVGWDWISIVDPIFTLALLIGVTIAALKAVPNAARVALAFCALYMGLGALQHERAMAVQEKIAGTRGHQRDRAEVFPTIANQLVWRSLYEADGKLYADRIRVPWFGAKQWTDGTSVDLITVEDLPPDLQKVPRVVNDFRRFAWFSSDWVARAPDSPEVFGDVRYSLKTQAFDPIWGIRFHPGETQVTEWVDRSRDRDLRLSDLWAEIAGTHPAYRTVE
jgi:inner membrane protein